MSTLFFFLKKSDERRNGDKNKKKNGAHTNSCTTVQIEEHNIHVGCCLFSHITHNKHHSNNMWIVVNVCIFEWCFSCYKCGDTKKEKKTEHTRMYAQLCSSMSAIFTSVVVYSRTSPASNKKYKSNSGVLVSAAKICICLMQ